MKTLHLSIIIGIGIAIAIIVGIFTTVISSQQQLPMQPKKIKGLENDTGIVALGNQAYYFTTVNDTMTTYRGEGVQELFHNVVFTFFPSPFAGGPVGSCGEINFGSDVKFSDGTHELLNVPVLGLPCGKDYFKTDLSNHTNPQAGLAVYDEKIKLLVSTQREFAVAPQGSNQIIHYYVDSVVKPKVELYDYYYDGIGKDNGTVSINNKTYYQTTLNYADYDLKKGTSIQFQNVIFTFPEGTMNTPGGSFIMLDIKFPDGSEEIYGENKKNPDGSGALGGIGIPTQYGPHLATNSTTVLGDHIMPQAGMTIYNDKIKLLVSTENKSQQNVANISNSILVTNTNFTINYNITADNKLLDAVLDSKIKTLELSMQASSNGTLTVTVPRALLDSKTNNGQDDMFVLLIDGRETNYMQTTSFLDRTLTIPFEQGAMRIKIIATQII